MSTKIQTCGKCQCVLTRYGTCADCADVAARDLLREFARPSMWVVIARHIPGGNEFVCAFADYQEAEDTAAELNRETPWVFHDVVRSDVAQRELQVAYTN